MKKTIFAAVTLAAIAMICVAAVPLRSLSPESPVPTASDISTSTAAETARAQAAESINATQWVFRVAALEAVLAAGANTVITNNVSHTNIMFIYKGVVTNNVPTGP